MIIYLFHSRRSQNAISAVVQKARGPAHIETVHANVPVRNYKGVTHAWQKKGNRREELKEGREAAPVRTASLARHWGVNPHSSPRQAGCGFHLLLGSTHTNL
jgi:hypothetical protein